MTVKVVSNLTELKAFVFKLIKRIFIFPRFEKKLISCVIKVGFSISMIVYHICFV